MVAAGHSFGAIAAVEFGRRQLPNGVKCKAVLAYDASYFPFAKEVLSKKFFYSKDSPPLYLLQSSTFPDRVKVLSNGVNTNHQTCINTFVETSLENGALLEQTEFLGYHHEAFSDLMIILPVEIYAMYRSFPHADFGKVYGLSAKLGINFLDKVRLEKPFKVHKVVPGGARDVASIKEETRFEEY
jgi:hypothetical protein